MAGESFGGTCFCGAVEVKVTGAPEAMGFCHCDSCRKWSASPVNAFTLWKPNAVEVTKGEAKLREYQKTPKSVRRYCADCGGHVMTFHPPFGLVDVYSATIPEFPFKAAVHVNYGDKVLGIVDGLPKFKDFPKEMGGSGEMLPE